MTRTAANSRTGRLGPVKAPTGIRGLDEITNGGLPAGRPTLVCGNAGCGKTLLATEFLVKGVIRFDEPGVLMTFEETSAELAENVASLGFDLGKLTRRRRLFIDYVHVEPVLKSRGMPHSSNIHELHLTATGIRLSDFRQHPTHNRLAASSCCG